MESMSYDSTIELSQIAHVGKGVMGGAGNLRVVHAVDVDAVNAVSGEVADLLAGVLDTRTGLGSVVITRTHEALHNLGGDGRTAIERAESA